MRSSLIAIMEHASPFVFINAAQEKTAVDSIRQRASFHLMYREKNSRFTYI
jgi:hypothetical protein